VALRPGGTCAFAQQTETGNPLTAIGLSKIYTRERVVDVRLSRGKGIAPTQWLLWSSADDADEVRAAWREA
jgi:hypothetical protein